MKIVKTKLFFKQVLYVLGVFMFSSGILQAEKLDNGYYIKINSTTSSEIIYQKLGAAINENCWIANPYLFDTYIYLPSSTAGFSLVQVESGVESTFSASANFGLVKDWLYYEPQPQANFFRGQYNLGTQPFSVTEAGLYYFAAEVNTHWLTFVPIKAWNVLGTATPGGWEPAKLNFLYPVFSEDKKSAVFSIDSLEVKPGFMKFRFTNGWKITVDSISDNECWNKGSKVNASFGGNLDSLVLGGGNIASHDRGIYSVKLFWVSGKSLKANFTKLKDNPIVDYSDYKIGIFGEGYLYADGKKSSWERNWGDGKETNVPVKDGSVYTWTFNDVTLFHGAEFKFRQGTDWMGLAIDFQDVNNWSGNAKSEIRNMDGKFHVTNNGKSVYKIILKIDANSEIVSVIIDKV